MKKIVDLNSDLGEGFGIYKLGLDDEILQHVTSANIACGFHAGDPLIMEKTVLEAKKNGVELGAHPGYPDLIGFGRRSMNVSPEEARAYMIYQLGALEGFAKAAGKKLQHMKLHGGFYHAASANRDLALAVIEGILDFDKDLIVMALSGSLLAELAKEKGLRVAQEVFADRAYNADKTLVDRSLPGAIIYDKEESVKRIKKMLLEGKVTSIDGQEIDIVADSICVHGDNPEAINFVKYIRESLEKEGIEFKAINEFI